LGDSLPLLSSAYSTNGIEENQAKQEESESSHVPLIEEKLNISKGKLHTKKPL
jgi:stress response protein YsnF